MDIKKLEEQIGNMKVSCPECRLPHSLSSRDIERIITEVNSYTAEIIGEDEKPYAGHRSGNSEFVATRNWLRAEQRIRAGITDTQGKEDEV